MRLVPEKSSLPRLLVFPFGLVALAGLVLARFQSELVLNLAHCPLRNITGLPCPTCGGTHTAIFLSRGMLLEALQTNPMVTVSLILFGIWLLAGLLATAFPGLRRELELTPGEKKTARYLAAFLFIVAWIWQIRILGV